MQTWGRKRRDRMGEKAGIYTPTLPLTFGFSLSSAIKNVHTYPHTKWVEDPEKEGNYTPPVPSFFGFSLSPAKERVHLYAHQKGRHMCAYMADEKKGAEGAKRRMFFPHTKRGRRPCEKEKELRRYPLFALLFVFLCFAFLCSFLSFFWI